ncbi:MAG: hypothetical protein WAL87_06335 [Chthoniobacterales bacterium]
MPTFAGSFFSALGYVAARLPYDQIRLPSRALPKLKTPLPAKMAQKEGSFGDFWPLKSREGAFGGFYPPCNIDGAETFA